MFCIHHCGMDAPNELDMVHEDLHMVYEDMDMVYEDLHVFYEYLAMVNEDMAHEHMVYEGLDMVDEELDMVHEDLDRDIDIYIYEDAHQLILMKLADTLFCSCYRGIVMCYKRFDRQHVVPYLATTPN